MLFLKEFIIYKSKYDNIIICLFLGFLILIDFVIIVFFLFFFLVQPTIQKMFVQIQLIWIFEHFFCVYLVLTVNTKKKKLIIIITIKRFFFCC